MSATHPMADSHQARVSDGRTEEQGPVIGRIKRNSPTFFEKIHAFLGWRPISEVRKLARVFLNTGHKMAISVENVMLKVFTFHLL